jgi:hypothetical protein
MSFGRDIAMAAAADMLRVILFALVVGGVGALLLWHGVAWIIRHVHLSIR